MLVWAAALLVFALPAHEGLHEQIDELTRRIAVSPGDAGLHLRRAELHRLHADFELALVDLRVAGEADPALIDVDLVRGETLLAMGALERAERALDHFLARAPRDAVGARVHRAPCARAHFARGTVRERRGAPAVAEADFAQALRLTPRPTPEHHLALARAIEARGEPERARAILREAVERHGPAAALELGALELELRLGRHDLALELIAGAEARTERKEVWITRRGDVLALQGRRNEARAAWREALEAIARLPSKQRRTSAVHELQERLRTRLAETGRREDSR